MSVTIKSFVAAFIFIFINGEILAQNLSEGKETDTNHSWQGISIKTNVLYNALALPNVSVGFHPYSPLWSIEATAIVPWWSDDKNKKRFRLQEYKLKYIYHFKERSRHHLSAGVIGGLYDFKFSSTKDGYKGEFMGGEIGYNYSILLKKHFSIEVGLGLGYIKTTYEKYFFQNQSYFYKSTQNTNYWGPTSLSLSFVWSYSL